MQTPEAPKELGWWPRRVGMLLIPLFALAGCIPVQEYGFRLELDRTTVAVGPSGSSTIRVTILRSPRFTLPVEITVEGLPAGVSAVIHPKLVWGDVAIVELRVSYPTEARSYPLLIVAESQGLREKVQVLLDISREGFFIVSMRGCETCTSCSIAQSLTAVDVWSGRRRALFQLTDPPARWALATNPLTNTLYAAGSNCKIGEIMLIDLPSRSQTPVVTLEYSQIMALAFSPTGQMFVVLRRLSDPSRWGRLLCAVDSTSGIIQSVVQVQEVDGVVALDFAPDGTLWAILLELEDIESRGQYLATLDPSTGQVLSRVRLPEYVAPVRDISYAPDGLIYGAEGERLIKINPATGHLIARFGCYDDEGTSLLGLAAVRLP